MRFSATKKFKTLCLAFAIVSHFSHAVFAQNKVVVIPLFGDDSPARLEPFSLISPDDTSIANYSINSGVVLDLVTGLEWQRIDNNAEFSYIGATVYCADLLLDGKTDWRVPTLKELFSIVDIGTFSPAINGMAFPATESLNYWTESELKPYSNRRHAVIFSAGVSQFLGETNSTRNRVRCVRSNGANALINIFENNDDGTVTDLASGLIWQQQDDNVDRSHAAAISYCQNLALAGYNNWRLPEAKELLSIIDFRNSSPAIDEHFFPNTSPGLYWSIANAANNPVELALAIFFSRGDIIITPKSGARNVRCVH